MEAINNLPESFVISESKINTQTVDRVIKAINGKDWAAVWKKRNLNESPSDIEKLPEVVAEISNTNPNVDMTTLDYNKALCSQDINHLYEHTHVTVAFTNVSRNFIFSLRDMDGSITVSDLPTENVVFWVPPCVLEKDQNAVEYGKILDDGVKRVDKLWKEVAVASTDHPFKVRQAMDSLMPGCASTNCVATTTIDGWKKIAFRNSQYWSPDESRYVFLHLVRNLKMRYPSVFYDVTVEDQKGQQFGLDSLAATPYAWKELRLAKKREEAKPAAKPLPAKPLTQQR